MARRSDHSKEELKTLILEETKKIVESEGLAGLTARRLAHDIGYTAGTLYHLFGSMEGIIFAVNQQTLSKLSKLLNNPKNYPQNATLENNLKTMAKIYIDFTHSHRQLWLMIFNHILPQNEQSPDWYKEQVINLFNPLEEMLSPLFSEKNKEENILATRVLWLSVHGICFMEETQKTSIIPNNNAQIMINYLIDLFVAGIKAR